MPGDDKVEHSAVGIVEKSEKQRGRIPTVMPDRNTGYDVESFKEGSPDRVDRYIEVKGLSGDWNDLGVGLTPSEVEFGAAKGDEFWLYIVEYALDPDQAIIHRIQNPIEKLTDYRFDRGWIELCTERDEDEKLAPLVDAPVRVTDKGDGVIVDIRDHGELMRLEILFDDGSTAKFSYPNSDIALLEE